MVSPTKYRVGLKVALIKMAGTLELVETGGASSQRLVETPPVIISIYPKIQGRSQFEFADRLSALLYLGRNK